MRIDTSGLQDWPDPETLFTAASSLLKQGTSFHGHVEDAHSTWKGLAECYETPHQDLLYSALDPALDSAQHALDGCVTVQTAMTLFADAISGLVLERKTLESEAEAYSATTFPDHDDEAQAHRWEEPQQVSCSVP